MNQIHAEVKESIFPTFFKWLKEIVFFALLRGTGIIFHRNSLIKNVKLAGMRGVLEKKRTKFEVIWDLSLILKNSHLSECLKPFRSCPVIIDFVQLRFVAQKIVKFFSHFQSIFNCLSTRPIFCVTSRNTDFISIVTMQCNYFSEQLSTALGL